jgi:hypothetical protein
MAGLPFWFLSKLPDIVQRALEGEIDVWQRRLACWTLLVAIGVMWELGATAAEKSKRKEPRVDRLVKLDLIPDHSGPVRKPVKRARFLWMSLFEVAAAALVVAGVGGELYIAAYIPVVEARLRAFTDAEGLRQRQAIAETSLRASQTEQDAAQLKKEAARLQRDGEDLKNKNFAFATNAERGRCAARSSHFG